MVLGLAITSNPVMQRIYFVLVLVRYALIFSPGYIHPDEYLQSLEIWVKFMHRNFEYKDYALFSQNYSLLDKAEDCVPYEIINFDCSHCKISWEFVYKTTSVDEARSCIIPEIVDAKEFSTIEQIDSNSHGQQPIRSVATSIFTIGIPIYIIQISVKCFQYLVYKFGIWVTDGYYFKVDLYRYLVFFYLYVSKILQVTIVTVVVDRIIWEVSGHDWNVLLSFSSSWPTLLFSSRLYSNVLELVFYSILIYK